MSVLAQAIERRKKFHAEIARRASLLAPPANRSYSIPNTPYGVKKIAPEVIQQARVLAVPARNYMADWYHCMWFFDLIEEDEKPSMRLPLVEHIQQTVALFYGVSRDHLTSSCRTAEIVKPRHVAMYLCRKLTKKSFPQIAKRFGGRDHSTLVHAVEKISSQLLHDEKLFSDIATLTAMVQA
jgi:hypothetical protein